MVSKILTWTYLLLSSYSACLAESSLSWFLRADGLGWQMSQEGTSYYLETNTNNFGTVVGNYIYPEFNFQGAWRIGGGVASNCNHWQLEGIWTHYGQKFTSNSNTRGLTGPNAAIGLAQAASSQFRTFFNLIDIQLSQSYHAATCLAFRPYFGVRGLLLRDKNKISYSNIGGSGVIDTYENKVYFHGAGIQCGLGVDWRVCRWYGDWGLVSDASYSVIQGKYQNSVFDPDTANDGASYTNIHQNPISFKSVVQLAGGLQWSADLSCGKVVLALLYESLYLPNIYEMPKIPTGFVPQGDLGFSGVTLSGRLGF